MKIFDCRYVKPLAERRVRERKRLLTFLPLLCVLIDSREQRTCILYYNSFLLVHRAPTAPESSRLEYVLWNRLAVWVPGKKNRNFTQTMILPTPDCLMSVPHLSETSGIKFSSFILPFTLLFTLIVVDRPQANVVNIL